MKKTRTALALAILYAGATALPVTGEQPSLARQVYDMPMFMERLEWTGAAEPPEADSVALLQAGEVFAREGIDAGFKELERFFKERPNSAWAASLHLNVGQYYRNMGQFQRALHHWTTGWNKERDSKDEVGQRMAVANAANLGCLLSGLGKKEGLEALLNDLETRDLPQGLAAQSLDITRTRLYGMQMAPGRAYRCGLMALAELAKALGTDGSIKRHILQTSAPAGGFTFANLLDLGQTHGISLRAVRRTIAGEVPVPCLAHWKLDHFGAILKKENGRYLVADPTFGSELWVRPEVLEEELSGLFLLPGGTVPLGFQPLNRSESAAVVGRGYPNTVDDDEDGPNREPCAEDEYEDEDCDPPNANDGEAGGNLPPPPCCGMPVWRVSEPHINLWLVDAPLFYRLSNGKWQMLKLAYKQRGENTGTRVGGFGNHWSCNWFGMLQAHTNGMAANRMTNFMAGGGKRPFDVTGATLEYRSARRLLLDGTLKLPMLVTPRSTTNRYSQKLDLLTGQTNYLWSHRIDAYNRTNRFEHQTSGSVVRLARFIDRDGRTNTIAYNNASFPHLVTSVTSPYGDTAYFTYNESGWLTNIVDMAGLSTSFKYDPNGVITNMTTPYGSTGFEHFQGTNPVYSSANRACRVTEPNGDKQLFAYYDNGPEGIPGSDFPYWRNSYHWNPAQYEVITTAGKSNPLGLEAVDTAKAAVRHWLHGATDSTVTSTLNAMAGPTNDSGGRAPWWLFRYYGQPFSWRVGTLERVTEILENNATMVEINRNTNGRPTRIVYHNADGTIAPYTNFFDAPGRLLQKQTGPNGELVRGYGYHATIPNLLVSVTNAVGEVIRYTHDSNMKVTSITFPSGLVRSNFYYTSGDARGFLKDQIDVGLRTNSFGYVKGNVAGHTNELKLVVSNTWDNLNRLVKSSYPDGTTVSNWFDKLDVRGVKDRLNRWTFYGYDSKRRQVATTNAAGQVTLLSYCGCGSPDTITQFKGTTPIYTYHTYDLLGRLTHSIYPDNYQVSRTYGTDGEVREIWDNAGRRLVLTHTQLGLRHGLAYAELVSAQGYGQPRILEQTFDKYGRITNSIDRDLVQTQFAYDNAGRVTRRQTVGSSHQMGAELFYYNTRGLTNYVDPLGFSTRFVRDLAGRITFQTNANSEVLEFTYNPADQLTILKDGKGQTTKWNYDAYGQVTNKVDAANAEIFRYGYDAGGQLTNRWTVAKGNTFYTYDLAGNLTNIAYPTFTNRLAYDNLNRLVGLVDQAGTTGFTWTDGNQVASEDGPWNEDTVNYAYLGRQRQSHSVVQPNASPWVQGYVYDDLARLRSVSSPAGTVDFEYAAYDLETTRTFNGGSSVQTASDTLARTTSKYLWATGVEGPSYSYDAASQRTQAVFSAGNYINYTYDSIGQLKTAFGYESGGGTRLNERYGYAYDGAWNLNRRTNNALVQTFNVNNLNQLTTGTRSGTLTVAGTVGNPNATPSVTVSGTGLTSGAATMHADGTWARAGATLADGANSYTATATAGGRTSVDSVSYALPATVTFTYDGNGNLTSDGSRTFEYDFENQLTNVYVATKWRSEFVYDTLMRRRVRKEYTWQGGTWVQTNEVRYVYDQRLVVQERWYNPQVSLSIPQRLITYTRGNDLSRDLQEAGGIGGLLARSDSSLMQSDPVSAHVFYATDASGNVKALLNSQNTVVARYQYDPYGNIISMSGPMAEANLYRFSSKEYHPNSGLVYYLYRYYEPNLQRWLNQDPLGDIGSLIYQTADIAPWNEEEGDVDEVSEGALQGAWIQANRNLYGTMGNSPVNMIDPLGLAELPCGGGPGSMNPANLEALDMRSAAEIARDAARAAARRAAASTRSQATKALRSAMNPKPGFSPHHRIPWKAAQDNPLIKKAAEGGWNLNGANNGVNLPTQLHNGWKNWNAWHKYVSQLAEKALNRAWTKNPNMSAERAAAEAQRIADWLGRFAENACRAP